MTKPRRAWRRLPEAALLVALTGCLPAAVTDRGREVAWLYDLFFVAAAIVFVFVAALIGWSVVRYRGAPGRDVALPEPVHGNLRLEIMWWALPTALVVLLIGFTWVVLAQVDAREEEPSLTIEVEGFQWGWRFTYEEADVVVSGTAADPPTLTLPTERTIAFVITSTDVVHSFSIPAFLIKRDALPTRKNRFDVVIELAGTYGGQCGEFCGLLHARQLFEIKAVPGDEFDTWLASQARTEP
ncbi:MAG: cytochrome c oxidase subunit II [Chloroflexi bacterium]|nr:cytochrome c oxidase subunit II [Chloroflexota bacterium]